MGYINSEVLSKVLWLKKRRLLFLNLQVNDKTVVFSERNVKNPSLTQVQSVLNKTNLINSVYSGELP